MTNNDSSSKCKMIDEDEESKDGLASALKE